MFLRKILINKSHSICSAIDKSIYLHTLSVLVQSAWQDEVVTIEVHPLLPHRASGDSY